jgi:hypothetical protein
MEPHTDNQGRWPSPQRIYATSPQQHRAPGRLLIEGMVALDVSVPSNGV